MKLRGDHLCLLEILMNRKKSLALADDKCRRGGETVGGIIYLTVKRTGSLEQPKEAAQKPAKHSASCRECRALEACQNQTGILTDLSKSERLPTQTKDSDQGVNSFSFLVTLRYFPVSSPVVQLFLYLHRKGICDSFWKPECCGCQAYPLSCWLRVWPDPDLEGSPVVCGRWCNRPAHQQAGGGFNSLGLSSLLVTIRQKLPWHQCCETGDKSGLPLGFVTKAALEPSHAHSQQYPLRLLSHKNWAAGTATIGLQDLNYLLSGPLQKKSANLWFKRRNIKRRQCHVTEGPWEGGSPGLGSSLGSVTNHLPWVTFFFFPSCKRS